MNQLNNTIAVNSQKSSAKTKMFPSIELAVDAYQKIYQQPNKLIEQNDIFNYVFQAYYGKISRLSVRNRNEDLIQELSVVLHRAALNFKIDSGVKFNTFFWKCARNHLKILQVQKNAQKRVDESKIVSMNQKISSNQMENSTIGDFQKDDKSERDFDTCLNNIVFEHNIFPNLKDNDVKIVKMLLEGYTLEDIGKQMNVTAPAIHIRLKRLVNRKEAIEQLRSLQQHARS